ncbi:nSTAND1 domain-containing NTPase [Micromonospora psammae]|uniref:nSTAND1 domain-containing NTPase n=1 Tax=Micromonospora sp. CPCC 205556 TaxID=3122398 RepID=UPI002FF38DB1
MTDSVQSDDLSDLARINGRAEFAAALTAQRELAGLTVRQVAAKAGGHSASSTIGDWFAGRGLPSLASQDLLLKVLTVCQVPPTEIDGWLEAWRRVRRSPGPRPQGLDPYRGLAPFQPDDARWFFGRDGLTASLVEAVIGLHAAGGGLLLVVGASGSGKSSLLRAGLIAALQSTADNSDGHADHAAADPGGWTVELMTPGTDPQAELEVRATRIRSACGPALLVVDQAEELFTALPHQEAADFIDELAALPAVPVGAVVVLGLRADFYAHALSFPPLLDAAQRRQVTVGPLTPAELRSVIVEPARSAGVEIEDGLIELLLADLAVAAARPEQVEAGVLPLLSHALFATWRHDQGRRLTFLGYRKVGRVQGAVAATAGSAYDSLTPAQQRIARRLLVRLVHVGVDTPDTRRVVRIADLLEAFGAEAAEAQQVLDLFITQRLVTAETGTVQISHEALLTAWPALRDWLAGDRAGLVLRQQVAAAATGWRAEQRDPAGLYAGTRLAAAQEWADDHPEEVSPLEREFLEHSIRHVRRRTRRLYQTVAALTALVLVSCVLAGYAFQQRSDATSQRRAAVAQRNEAYSRLLASRADWLRSRDTTLARHLALAAYRVAPTVEARSSLLDAAATPTVTRLAGFTGAAQAVTFSSDRRLFAAAGTDGRVRLWDATATPTPAAVGEPLAGPNESLFAVTFSPDGRLLAAAGTDKQIHLWRLDDQASPHRLAALTGPTSTVYSLAFSPDGRVLAAGSADRNVWLWTSDGSRVHTPAPSLAGPGDAVQAVAFSPDGRLLAAGSADRTVHLWALADRRRPTAAGTLRGHDGKVLALAFSPNGALLASGSGDNSVRLWDLRGPRPVLHGASITGPSSWVNAIAFSPDGNSLAIGSSDKNLTVVKLTTRRVIQTLPHPAPITALAFGARGETLVSSSTDGFVRQWALPGPLLAEATGSIFTTAFSPNGGVMVTASRDETIQLWRVEDPRRPTPLTAPIRRPGSADGYAGTAAFRPDGRLLAVGSRSGDVELWDVARPDRPIRVGPPLVGAAALIETIAFTRDGSLLAAAGDDGNTYLWDVTRPDNPRPAATIRGDGAMVLSAAFHPRLPVLATADTEGRVRLFDVTTPAAPRQLGAPLHGSTGYAYSVAFSPDGRILAVGGADKTVRLWALDNTGHPRPLPRPLLGPTSYAYWVTFSPDGATIAAASTDGTVWLWDVRDPQRPAVVASLGHTDEAFYVVAFSPDGHTIAAGSADATARIWETDPKRLAAGMCATVGAPVTAEEWAQYVPGVPYSPAC